MIPGRLICLCLSLLLPLGCAASGQPRSDANRDAQRNPQLAAELTHQASQLIESDPTQAMQLLRQAIEADLFHGPAHNDLGVLLLNQGDLYAAAEEFDWARRLMPGHPDPRLNLGIALERGGKTQDALDAYASANEVYPNYLPAMQAMTRLQLRSGNVDESTHPMLQAIAFRAQEPWKSWAIKRLAQSPADLSNHPKATDDPGS